MPFEIKPGKRCGYVLLALTLLSASFATGIDRDGVIGTWEGESKCTVPNSPCHDEHVIYEIVGDKRKKDVFKIDAYKVLQQREFMGSVDCTLPSGSDILTCSAHTANQDVWEFKIVDARMEGTLVVGPQKQLYRRISLEKRGAGQ